MESSDSNKADNRNRERLFSGAVWSTSERIASQSVTFLVTIILARILTPTDFGLIGMISIFIDFGVILSSSGLSQALIKRAGGSDSEGSGVLLFNIFSGICLYALIWISSPYIADFYAIPRLCPLIRTIAVAIPIRALSTVALARLSAQMNFLRIAIATISSLILAGALGIFAAIRGLGVYAIVVFQIANALLTTAILWIESPTIKLTKFNFKHFRNLLKFGSHLSIAAVADLIYNNAYLIAIGKLFPASDVGYFSRGRQFASVPPISIGEIIRKVAYPVLCRYESNLLVMGDEGMKILRITMFVAIPMMMAISINAESLVISLLGEKWLFSAGMLNILCFGAVWIPMDVLNMTMLPAAGKPALLMKLEIARKGIGILSLICSLPFGLKGICYGYVIGALISLILTLFISKKIFNISFRRQCATVSPFIIPTIVAVGGGYYYSTFVFLPWLKASIGIGGAAVVYLSIARLFSFPELTTISTGLKRFLYRL